MQFVSVTVCRYVSPYDVVSSFAEMVRAVGILRTLYVSKNCSQIYKITDCSEYNSLRHATKVLWNVPSHY